MAESDKNEIYLSSSPHVTKGLTTDNLMKLVLIALLPEVVYGIYLFGIKALITILVSVISCVVFEALFQKFSNQKVTVFQKNSKGKMFLADSSAILTGFLLALVLPATTPIWQTVLGAFFAIVVAKGFFGGLGSNVYNPALTGRAFLFVSFSASIGASWLKPTTDVISSATLLSDIKAGTASITSSTYLNYFLGHTEGCIGETSVLLILISFIFLVATKVIDWRAPLAMIATVAVATLLAGGDVLIALLSGGLIFGATFMVTDYVTTPVTKKGRIVFGFGCGIITFLIRQFGGYPEGVMFSILIMNSITAFLNNLTCRKYGYKLKNEKAGDAK